MLKLNKDQMRRPIGGHHFTIHSITFRDETFDGLLEKIKEFRVANMVPIGDPHEEVLQYYADYFPYMVQADGKPYNPKIDGDYDLWARWIGRAWRNPPKSIVATKEAEMRMDTCRTCPHNKPIDIKKTPESQALNQRAYLLRRGYERPKDIHFCALHKADISVLSFCTAPDALSEKESSAEPQASCWVGSLKGS